MNSDSVGGVQAKRSDEELVAATLILRGAFGSVIHSNSLMKSIIGNISEISLMIDTKLTDGLEVGVRFAPQSVRHGEHFDVIAGAWEEVINEDRLVVGRYLARLHFARIVPRADYRIFIL